MTNRVEKLDALRKDMVSVFTKTQAKRYAESLTVEVGSDGDQNDVLADIFSGAVKGEFRAYGVVQKMVKYLLIYRPSMVTDEIDAYHDGLNVSNNEVRALRKRVIDSSKALVEEKVIRSPLTIVFEKVMTAEGPRKVARIKVKKSTDPRTPNLIEQASNLAKEHGLTLEKLAEAILEAALAAQAKAEELEAAKLQKDAA